MNKFDAAALPMRSVFTTTPDPKAYEALASRVPLDRMNPAASALKGKARQAAVASLKMNFDEPDAAPEDQLNRILWRGGRGRQVTRTAQPEPHRRGAEPQRNSKSKPELAEGAEVTESSPALETTARFSPRLGGSAVKGFSYRRVTVRPVRDDSRAASRISVTIMLFSSDESPEGLIWPRTTAIR